MDGVSIMYIISLLSVTAVTYTTEPDSSRSKDEIVSVVLTTTNETEDGLELLVTVATPDTQQDVVIEGNFETGIQESYGESCVFKTPPFKLLSRRKGL